MLLVVSAKGTKRNQVRQLVGRFRNLNANIVGIALNKYPKKKVNDIYYYSYGTYDDSLEKREAMNLDSGTRQNWKRNGIKGVTNKLAKK